MEQEEGGPRHQGGRSWCASFAREGVAALSEGSVTWGGGVPCRADGPEGTGGRALEQGTVHASQEQAASQPASKGKGKADSVLLFWLCLARSSSAAAGLPG